jgi:anti-sigma factor RsiW
MSMKTKKVCEDVKTFLNRYQDDELDRETREKVRAHLSECAPCKQELEFLEHVTARVKQLPEVETTANFTAVVMGKIWEKEEQRTRWFKLPSLAYSFIFILFLLLGLWFNRSMGSRVPDLKTGKDQPVYITQLLTESQDLQLINVQDNAIELLGVDNGNNNGK